MQNIHSWAALFAVPGVRPVAVGILLFVVAGVTYGGIMKSHGASGTAHAASLVVEGEVQRNVGFEAPDDHQMRWHIKHAREDISHMTLLLGMIHATLRAILAVLIAGALLMAF